MISALLDVAIQQRSNHRSKMDTTQLRAVISSCRLCVDHHPDESHRIINLPKHGAGKGRELMVVGLNPPEDQTRAMYGAFMLHNPGHPAAGPHEKLVAELVALLGLDVKQVTATNIVKCPTLNNSTPSERMINTCWAWFTNEVRICDPKVTLLFGETVHVRAMFHLRGLKEARLSSYTYYKMAPVGKSPERQAFRVGTIICAPHPSVVGRFVERESWLQQIKLAYTDACGVVK
jgi:uracil-DNA glycosylase family 4